MAELACRLSGPDDPGLPTVARSALLFLGVQFENLAEEAGKIERQLVAWHRQNQASQRLERLPGVGVITATVLAASSPDPAVLSSGHLFAAYLSLVLRQNSSGGKERLGRVSRTGNGYLRWLLVVGTTSVTRRAPTNDTRTGVWFRSLLERMPTRLVTVPTVTKTTRTALALLAKRECHKAAPAN